MPTAVRNCAALSTCAQNLLPVGPPKMNIIKIPPYYPSIIIPIPGYLRTITLKIIPA